MDIKDLVSSVQTLGNPTRLKIFEYCLQRQNYSSLIFDLRLNPASLKHHIDILINHGLIRKVGRGQYETTSLGKLLYKCLRKIASEMDQ